MDRRSDNNDLASITQNILDSH